MAMVLELAGGYLEPDGKTLYPSRKKGVKEMQHKPEPSPALQDNSFYWMPISSNGIKL